jgi:hypothetical protein
MYEKVWSLWGWEYEKVGGLAKFSKKNSHYEIIISTTLVNYRGFFFLNLFI